MRINRIKPEITRLQNILDGFFKDRKKLKILEAGCGSFTEIQLPKDAELSGIDISEKQLERNSCVHKKILGDIQTYPLNDSEFDIIVCFYLLEHLPKPELAMKNFVKAIKEDGLIVLVFPNVLSLWGIITKLTPLWFHVFVYKYIFGEKKSGTEDFGPFRTFSRASIAPEAIKSFAIENGLEIEYLDLYENFRQREMREQVGGVVWSLVKGITQVLTLGTIDPKTTDCILVLKKPSKTIVKR